MNLAFMKQFYTEIKEFGLGYEFWLTHIKRTDPEYVSIETLNPASTGFTIMGKITATTQFDDKLEAVIVDSTGSIIISLTKYQTSWVNEGDCVIVKNAKIEMVNNGYMRVELLQKGLQKLGSNWDDTLFKQKNNLSDVEYELVV